MVEKMCEYCDIIAQKKTAHVLYEDEQSLIFIKNPKQIISIPKQHYIIMEQVPEEVLAHLFNATSKISSILFEALGAEGSNFIIHNGVAAGQTTDHFSVNTIFRASNDGFNFAWPTTKPSQDELLKNQEQIVNGLMQLNEKKEEEKKNEDKPKEPQEQEPEKKERKEKRYSREHVAEIEDYRIRQLIRMP